MSSSRKRYRPLELGEERSITAADSLQIDVLINEKSYRFSWPEAALSTTLSSIASSPDTKSQLENANNFVLLPRFIRRESQKSEIQNIVSAGEKRNPLHRLPNSPSLQSSSLAPKGQRSNEDSIFSLTCEQVADAYATGVLRSDVSDDYTRHARRAIENEIVQLEWRAFREAKHTAAALQRLLSLEAAVPFLSLDYVTPSENAWRKKVFNLWIHWRTHGAENSIADGESQRWGMPLLCGAFLHGAHDYFLRMGFAHASENRSAPSSTFNRDCLGNSRRRTPYNFLCWRVERLAPYISRNQSTESVLNTKDAMKIMDVVLSQPYSRLELDESHNEAAGIGVSDLENEIETWRIWLEKV